MCIFFAIIVTDPFKKTKNSYWMKSISLYVGFISVSFVCVTSAASRIHEADRKAKEVQEAMLKNVLSSSEKNYRKELLFLFVVQNSKPFTLSAWGFFNFNKGAILSTIGSILTYSLLIEQID
ncbi:uncharacterized protein CDAR_563831 [Caerostris darwini]|uniref:Gustatory receptor n=1 Tax=Caerostris darwini TaxID=1538125 RepID=A0AAV4UZJ8_9ARAC|nr:uncharacterized protein CDAR_563831 [Caerostris darwini]